MNPKYSKLKNITRPQYPDLPPMSIEDRAAQFSPFAAVVGYDDAVEETARLTDSMVELSEDEIVLLNGALAMLRHAHWAQTGRTLCEQTTAAEASQPRGRSIAATRQTSRDRPAAHIPQPVRARTGRAGRSGTRRARGYGGGGAPAS